MRVYFDSSALIKRSIQEPESDAVDALLERYVNQGAVVVASTLAWVEVSRAIRSLTDVHGFDENAVNEAIDGALSGVAERLITEDVIGLARRVSPQRLRTLDAVHLATAIVLDVDAVVTFDDLIADACRNHGLLVIPPHDL